MRIFTHEDCDQTGFGFSLKNKVVVLPQSVLPEDHPGQLFFCTGGNGANPYPIGRSVFLVSLSMRAVPVPARRCDGDAEAGASAR